MKRRMGAARMLSIVSEGICDECGKKRSVGRHTACSKKRQARHAGRQA